MTSKQRINRNILECKEIIQQRFLQNGLVLIETYWNVKVLILRMLLVMLLSINRNILECKVLNYIINRKFKFRINRNILECKVISTGRPSRGGLPY